jgi:hypothetical protein
MKKIILTLIIFSLTIFLFARQEQYQVTVRNIEVPTRVFLKGQFVKDLSIQDFELYENGIPQKIEALYLTSKKDILRKEELTNYNPQTPQEISTFFSSTQNMTQSWRKRLIFSSITRFSLEILCC